MKFFFAIFAVFFLFAGPVFALEDGKCLCYCKTDAGADYAGEKSSVDLCSSSCRQDEERMLGCFSDLSLTPEFSRLCYTKVECEADTETNPKGEELPSVWGGQESTCLPGRGHCYAAQGSGQYAVKLSVPIAGMTEVGDLGTYIVAIYRWLIGLGAFICVIVFTLAGFKWLLAGGNEESVSSAKGMMTNAILGMVLLLSAVMIATLIDPRTMEIGILKTPKLSPVALTIASDDCAQWAKIGVEIGKLAGAGLCGDKGIAVSTNNVPKNLASEIRVDDICTFRNCQNDFEYCVQDTSSANGFSCQRCSDQYVISDNSAVPVAPGEVADAIVGRGDLPAQCGLIEAAARNDLNAAGEVGQHMYCQFVEPAPTLSVLPVPQVRGCFEITYPNTVNDYTLSCDILRNDAAAAGAVGCRAYDLAYAKTGAPSDIAGYRVDDYGGGRGVYPLLERTCSDDPCGFAPPGESCEVYISGNDAAEDFCSSPIGYLLSHCEGLVNGFGRADCVNTSYADDVRNISNELQDESLGLESVFVPTFLTTRGIEAWYRSRLSTLDVDGNVMDYQLLW